MYISPKNKVGHCCLFSSTVSKTKVNCAKMLPQLFPDVVSANQKEAVGSQKDQDDEKTSEEAAMETENQEEDFGATEAQELKPEQLDSRKVSDKGKGCFCLTL